MNLVTSPEFVRESLCFACLLEIPLSKLVNLFEKCLRKRTVRESIKSMIYLHLISVFLTFFSDLEKKISIDTYGNVIEKPKKLEQTEISATVDKDGWTIPLSSLSLSPERKTSMDFVPLEQTDSSTNDQTSTKPKKSSLAKAKVKPVSKASRKRKEKKAKKGEVLTLRMEKKISKKERKNQMREKWKKLY